MNEHAAKLLMSMPFAVFAEAKGKLEAVFAEADHAAAFVADLGDKRCIVCDAPLVPATTNPEKPR